MESPLAGAALAPVALGVGYSRVHVGVHYPGDVVAGLAVGSAVAVATQHWWRIRPDGPGPGADGVRGARRCPTARGSWSRSTRARAPTTTTRRPTSPRLLPRAEVLETERRTPASTSCSARRRAPGRAKALGVAGGDGSVAAAAAVALEHGLPLAVIAGRHAQPLRPGRRPGDAAGHRRRRHLRVGRAGRRRRRQRDAVPQHREHRRLPGDGAPPRPAVGPDGQVDGADRGRGAGAADGRRRWRWWSTAGR